MNLIHPNSIDVRAVIFCGGPGTRMRSILGENPKSLIRFTQFTYLEGLLKQIRLEGIKKFTLCISKYSLNIINSIGNGQKFDLLVDYSIDSGEIGNAGALWHALPRIFERFLLCINGDTIFNVNVQNLISAHILKGALATLASSTRIDQPHVGGVEVGLDGWVKDIHEENQDLGQKIIYDSFSLKVSNTGIYVFNRKELEINWLENQRIGKIEEGLLRTLAKNHQLWAYDNGNRYLLDIGNPERYMKAFQDLDIISKFFPLSEN